jgi:hypothetical protein
MEQIRKIEKPTFSTVPMNYSLQWYPPRTTLKTLCESSGAVSIRRLEPHVSLQIDSQEHSMRE